MTLTQTSVINLLTEAMRDRLEEKLITELEDEPIPDDEGRAGLVLVGKLLADPTVTQINIIIRAGDENWEHTLNVADQTTAMREVTNEIGGYGGAINKRRFIIYVKIFFANEYDSDLAREKANVVLGRIENAFWTMDLRTIPSDSFGEKAMYKEVNDTWMRDSGGPGMLIYRGQVKVTFLTLMDIREVTN